MLQGKIKEILKFVLFLFFGVGIFWLVYRKQDPQKMWSAFEGVDFFWLGVTVFIMLISHISRSLRWVMLVRPLGKKVSFWNATLATFLGYFANMALPRLGEVTRCAVLGKYEKLSVSKLLGTVVVERAIDVLIFLLCLILAVVLQFDVFANLRERYLASSQSAGSLSYTWIYVSMTLLLICIIVYYKFRNDLKASKAFLAVKQLLKNVVEGFRAIWKLKNFNLFLLHTIIIWICYYLMMYFGFQVFEFSRQLSAVAALSIFVLGSLGMILPAPGGIGSFHFFVISGLVLYMPTETDAGEKAAAFALLIHGVQTIFIMISGVISLILLPIINAKKRKYE